MGFVIGANPYGGMVSETEFKRGKGMTPGNLARVTVDGQTREFVAVKLPAATYINGTTILIDADTGGMSAVLGSAPVMLANGRVGILVFASATATQTVAATSYGFVQIYGQCLARVSTTVSLFGVQLVIADSGLGHLISGATVVSTETQLDGITAIATTSTSGLLAVMLSYPRLRGTNDVNLS